MLAKVNKTTAVLKPEHLKLQQHLFLQYTQCIPKYQQPRKALKTWSKLLAMDLLGNILQLPLEKTYTPVQAYG